MTRLILIFAVYHYAKGNMTVTPRNAVVLAGDRVELECRVEGNSTVYRWEMSKPSTALNIENIIRLDNSGSLVVNSNFSHLGIDVDQTGSGVIYYNSTNLEDAGNYTCRAVIRSEKEKIFYSAQLIVLESLPNCTSNYSSENDSSKDFEAITLKCSLKFRGFWSLTMQWTQHDGNGIANGKGQKVEGGIETQTIPNSHVTSSLTVRRDSLSDGTFFSCRIYFERKFDGILIMNATNIPDFVYVWNSSVYSKDPSSSKPIEETETNVRLVYSVMAAVIGFGVVVFVAFAVVGYCKRKLSGKHSVYEARMALDDTAAEYETMPYATSDQYETIEEMPHNVVTSSSPRTSAMAGNAVILHAEQEAPNVYDRMRDLNASVEPYNPNEDQGHQINAASGERCYLELL